jgi:hypothetical protein
LSPEEANDVDWEQFENEAETIIKKCAAQMASLKEKAFQHILTSQQRQHMENLFFLLEKYLKGNFLFFIAKNLLIYKML